MLPDNRRLFIQIKMKLPYFKFNPSEYLTGDIQLCSIAAQGVFVNICCLYWTRSCVLTREQLSKRYDEALIAELSCVLKYEGEQVVIDFLNEQFDEISETKRVQSHAGHVAGLASAAKRAALPKTRAEKQVREIFGSDNLKEAVKEFKLFRRNIRKPMTEKAVDLLLAKLRIYDDATAVKMIEQSIERGWTTVYPLKEQQQAKVIPTTKQFEIPS